MTRTDSSYYFNALEALTLPHISNPPSNLCYFLKRGKHYCPANKHHHRRHSHTLPPIDLDTHLNRLNSPPIPIRIQCPHDLRHRRPSSLPPTILFDNRRFVNDLTGGKLGSPSGKAHWKWNWILNVGLNLLSNATIASIIKHSVGYRADFKLWKLTLFLLARPRLT
jgi:hypothetical protein